MTDRGDVQSQFMSVKRSKEYLPLLCYGYNPDSISELLIQFRQVISQIHDFDCLSQYRLGTSLNIDGARIQAIFCHLWDNYLASLREHYYCLIFVYQVHVLYYCGYVKCLEQAKILLEHEKFSILSWKHQEAWSLYICDDSITLTDIKLLLAHHQAVPIFCHFWIDLQQWHSAAIGMECE